MELRVLEYFLAIAREQSITGAARSLHLSQPTLSTQIRALEEAFKRTYGAERADIEGEVWNARNKAA